MYNVLTEKLIHQVIDTENKGHGDKAMLLVGQCQDEKPLKNKENVQRSDQKKKV